MRVSTLIFMAALGSIWGCDQGSPPRAVTDKEFTEMPTGVFFSESRGQITIEGGASGGTIMMGSSSGEWKMKSPGVMEMSVNGQTQDVQFTRGGGLDLTVTFPDQPSEVWTGQ
jgi:hypothetical protein